MHFVYWQIYWIAIDDTRTAEDHLVDALFLHHLSYAKNVDNCVKVNSVFIIVLTNSLVYHIIGFSLSLICRIEGTIYFMYEFSEAMNDTILLFLFHRRQRYL